MKTFPEYRPSMMRAAVLMVFALSLQACDSIPGNIANSLKQTPQGSQLAVSPETRSFLEAQCSGLPAPDATCGVLVGPDRLPVLSNPTPRGNLIYTAEPARTPSAKTVDGRIADWIGTPSYIGGNARWDAGEYIYTDYLFDAYGADDGVDQQRLSLLDPLTEAEPRLFRIDQLFQAVGDQFGIPPPLGAIDHYGDTTELDAQADLSEVRWAADAGRVYLLARTTTLTEEAALGILLLLDRTEDTAPAREVGFGSGLSTEIFDTAVLLTQTGAIVRDLASGTEQSLNDAQVATDVQGWDNALEASLPATLFGAVTHVAVISGPMVDGAITPANAAYRFNEPVAGVYNEKRQALALLAGNVDGFSATLNLDAMRGGVSESVRPGPGYHERQFLSGANISNESGESGLLQPYGLYVPTAYAPSTPNPLTFWLHYRGGKAHSGAAWTPRLITQLGEEQDNIVVTPRGRGTSTWYVTQAHQDFFEVFADVHALMNVDADRRYLSGYSMGGYGTYIFGLLYPDLFAAGYSTSGAVTQGAWTGIGPDNALCAADDFEIPSQGPGNACFIQANEGDGNAQLTYRLLENALHFPIIIHHGSTDELVPITGIAVTGLRLAQLGYRYDLSTFLGYEHFTQAIIDEWGDGAIYLNKFRRDPNPRKLVYKILPGLVNAINTIRANDVAFNFQPNGAYWARDLVVRDVDVEDLTAFGMIEAESQAIAAPTTLPLPRVVEGLSTPVFSPLQHSTPYVRVGLDWLELGQQPVANRFSATLTRLSAASLDAARMALDLSQKVEGVINSDGPLLLTLTSVGAPLKVTVNGVAHPASVKAGQLSIALEAGASQIVLQPAQ